ncbi:C-type lectin BfL-2-like [Haliotis rufescens]|uniref:C-type lectin BfL-2-like n=1 Tax=Haliotis rufescens TaxID=6454 RepID=UPI001EAFE017|nr:C-type lectin BfL-2-like [Haliotis rufescens]
MILNFFLSLSIISSFTFAVCPDGWTKYDQSCYTLYQGFTSWLHAGSFCREFGGHLATLNTTSKASNVQAFLTYVNHNATVWVGASDLRSEGLWVWDVDQASFTNTNWAPGEPNQGVGGVTTDQDCLALVARDNYKWHDIPCQRKYDYLCERRSTATL